MTIESPVDAVHLPDEMGVWAEDGELIWLALAHYPKRIDAIQWAMKEWTCSLPEVRCRKRFLTYDPFTAYNLDGSVAWTEDGWRECEKDAAGAFPAWRLEAA